MAESIQTASEIHPLIYCYTTPGVESNEGCVKIGYTDRQTPEARIRQQTGTAHVPFQLEWSYPARYMYGDREWFTDGAFHRYLTDTVNVTRLAGTEWFRMTPQEAETCFRDFVNGGLAAGADGSYVLRQEQENAVAVTQEYFSRTSWAGSEFLWNAKPRFGKTLAAYDLIQRMHCTNVLIVTNRPAIASSWYEDFAKFVLPRGEYLFVSENPGMRGEQHVYTRDGFVAKVTGTAEDRDEEVSGIRGMIAFDSLQNLKTSIYFGGSTVKLKWMCDLDLDLLIIDEAHEGVDTKKTGKALSVLKAKHVLYLSGTPFKALASGRFAEEQITNWTYADEQAAKRDWEATKESPSPYAELPQMVMYTYQMSSIIYDKVQKGMQLTDDLTIDYAFDLNEFFRATDKGEFVHKEDVQKFLKALVSQEKYPFASEEMRSQLSHTLWILDRVASAEAMAHMLSQMEEFRGYRIVVAAGKGAVYDEDGDVLEEAAATALTRVRTAVQESDRSITLSVGQLTVGITVPQWTGVLMLCNMKSPSAYMQAAFRAQNRWVYTKADENGETRLYRKEHAYVFDFDPARTLTVYDEYATSLAGESGGTAREREERILRLLNFFPVLGEDENGEMTALDAEQVLAMPCRLKSAEVVRRGFISNLLFADIGGIFNAPPAVQEILGKLAPAKDAPRNRKPVEIRLDDIDVDENGEAQVPQTKVIGLATDIFGPGYYVEVVDGVELMPEQEPDQEPQQDENAADVELTPLTGSRQDGEPEAETDGGPGEADDLVSSVIAAAEEKVNQLIQQGSRTADQAAEAIEKKVAAPVISQYKLPKSTQNQIKRDTGQELNGKIQTLAADLQQTRKLAEVELKQAVAEAGNDETKRAEAVSDFNRRIDSAAGSYAADVNSTVKEVVRDSPERIVGAAEKQKEEQRKNSREDDIRDRLRGFCRTIPSFLMAYGYDGITLQNFEQGIPADVFEDVTGITPAQFDYLRGADGPEDPTGTADRYAGHIFNSAVFNESINEFLQKRRELANYFDESQDEDIFDYIPPQRTNQIFTPRSVVRTMLDALEENNPGCFDSPDVTFIDPYMKSGMFIAETVKRLYRSPELAHLFPDSEERIRHILSRQVYGMAPTEIIYRIAVNYILGFSEEMRNETRNFVQADAAAAAKKGGGELQALVDRLFAGNGANAVEEAEGQGEQDSLASQRPQESPDTAS